MAGKGSTKVFAATLIAVAAVGAAIAVLMVRHAGVKVGGRVTVEKASIGSFAFTVNDCASGAAFVPGFFGADLRAMGGYALRVVDSGDNARLWFYSQGGKQGAVAVGKEHCSQWDVLVDWAHMKVNRVSTVSGHVRVTCAPVGGGTVKADVTFERCAL